MSARTAQFEWIAGFFEARASIGIIRCRYMARGIPAQTWKLHLRVYVDEEQYAILCRQIFGTGSVRRTAYRTSCLRWNWYGTSRVALRALDLISPHVVGEVWRQRIEIAREFQGMRNTGRESRTNEHQNRLEALAVRMRDLGDSGRRQRAEVRKTVRPWRVLSSSRGSSIPPEAPEGASAQEASPQAGPPTPETPAR